MSEQDNTAGEQFGGPSGEQHAASGDPGAGTKSKARTWYEEITVSGAELLEKVKEIVAEGNVRRVYIKNTEGKTLLEIPLTAGVAITAVTAVFAPVLVAVGAVAALLTSATIGVEREQKPGPAPEAPGPDPQIEA